MDEFHIQDLSNCCRHMLKKSISQNFHSHFWWVFYIWPICEMCVDKQMDEMQRKREQTFKDISARLDNSALQKDLDNLR